jgi:hypothetical protein
MEDPGSFGRFAELKRPRVLAVDDSGPATFLSCTSTTHLRERQHIGGSLYQDMLCSQRIKTYRLVD